MVRKNYLPLLILTMGFFIAVNFGNIQTVDAASHYEKGSSGKAVKTLQKDLDKAGFKVVNKPTTYYGIQTEKQVKKFQKAYGLKADGVAGQATLKKLDQVINNQTTSNKKSSQKNYYAKGMTDQKIKTLQKDLAKVGFKVVDKPTTYYGAETEKQVKKFQKANGLTADGIAGKATLDSLKKAASNQATSNSKKASSTNSSNYYKKGMTNKGVKTLQKNLAQAGFIVVDKPTTYFGTQTEKQVKAFQRKHGLTVDGIAGQATLNKLKSASTSKKSTSQLKSKYYLKGMTNTNIKTLQKDLAKAGFKVVDKPTTYYGVETEKQVKAFQKKYKLLPDGIAGQATLNKLNEIVKNGNTSKNVNKFYSKGMTNKNVKKLQQDLAKAGFKVVDKPTTYFGIQTEKQVKAFQKKHGLVVDGVAGVATLNKLEEAAKGNTSSQGNSNKSSTSYNISMDKALEIQMGNLPQTDNPLGWVSKDYVKNNKVTVDALNIRSGPSTSWSNIGSLTKGDKIKVIDDFKGWYAIEFKNNSWKHASPTDVSNYLDPSNNNRFQHLRLDKPVSSGTSDANLRNAINNELSGKGVLNGQGQAFINGARNNSINEFYLIVHAFLESGYGNSGLAKGYEVGVNKKGKPVLKTKKNKKNLKNVKKVYNMFGVGAVDNNPTEGGAVTAYQNGWTTPAKAIEGGASWIANQYVYNSYHQNTLYKMSFNPQMSSGNAWKRYATDIGWATKQAGTLERMYGQLAAPNLEFDLPNYK